MLYTKVYMVYNPIYELWEKKLKGTGSVFEVGGKELNEVQKSF